MITSEDIMDTLGYFNRQELISISSTKDWIDSLFNFCCNTHPVEIESYIRSIGKKSTLRLRNIQEMIESCRDYIIMHHKEISNQYELGRLSPWLTDYSLAHLDEDILYIYHAIINEDGSYEYPKNIQPMPWEYPDIPENAFEDEPESTPNLKSEDGDTYDQYNVFEDVKNCKDCDDDEFECDENLYPLLSEEELLKNGYPIGLAIENPFKRVRADLPFMDKLSRLNHTADFVRVLIDQYLSFHRDDPERISLADYAETIAPIINGEVFNEEPVDGVLLEKVLSAKDRCGLTIKKRKRARWTRIIHTLHLECPDEFNKQWLNAIVKVWGVGDDINKRPYDSGKKRPDEVLEKISESIYELTHRKDRSGN